MLTQEAQKNLEELREFALGDVIKHKWRERVFLIVEDDTANLKQIEDAVREKRGADGRDAGIHTATCYEDAEGELKKITHGLRGGETITLIVDFDLPSREKGRMGEGGPEVIREALTAVDEWNRKNTKTKPCNVELVFNSTVRNLAAAGKVLKMLEIKLRTESGINININKIIYNKTDSKTHVIGELDARIAGEAAQQIKLAA